MYSARVLMNGLMFGKDRQPGDVITPDVIEKVSHVVIKSMVNQGLIDMFVEGDNLASIPGDFVSDESKFSMMNARIDKLYDEVFKTKKTLGRPKKTTQTDKSD